MISFEDDGPGFELSKADRLFEPFHGSSVGGSGLGLAIVYRIVKEHGGDIYLANREAGGSRVTVELPLTASPAK